MASHPNSLADAIELIEAKIGVDNSVVVGTLDYILKKGRHTSTQAGAGSGTTAYEFDTSVAHTGSDVLVMLKSGGVERYRIGGGGPTSTYVEMGFGSAAAVGAAGKARLRVNEATGRLELSNNGGAYVPVAVDASGGYVTLDDAYDAGGAGLGRTITADSGAVVINNAVAVATNTLELTRTVGTGGALTVEGYTTMLRTAGVADGTSLLALTDANANPGRTVALMSLTDDNVRGAAVPTLFIHSTVVGPNLVGFQAGTYKGIITDSCGIYLNGRIAGDGGDPPGAYWAGDIDEDFFIGAASDIEAGDKHSVYVAVSLADPALAFFPRTTWW